VEAALGASKPPAQVSAPADLQRGVLTLLVEGHASYRGIQRCLAVLLGQQVSLGTITALVHHAGQRAQAWLEQQVSEQGRVLALDEQYRSTRGEAYLTVVDVDSAQVWTSLPAVTVDGESWTLALWYLQEQGVVSLGTVSDGGRAIQDALRTTKALGTHQRDVWHVWHLAGQVQARLERVVQDEEERKQVIERQEQHRATTGKQATGRPARTTASEPAQVLSQLHRVREGVAYLFAQLRALLEIVVQSRGKPAPFAQCSIPTRRSGDGARLVGGTRAVRSGHGAQRGAESQQAGAPRLACSAVLCRETGSGSASSHCSGGRRGGGTHRLGVATPSHSGQAAAALAGRAGPSMARVGESLAGRMASGSASQ